MRAIISVLLGLLLAGCMNVTTRLQRDDPSVTPRLEGSDCATWVLIPIMIGTTSVEGAMAKAIEINPAPLPPGEYRRHRPIIPISKLHRVQFTDLSFLFFGTHCVEVTGD